MTLAARGASGNNARVPVKLTVEEPNETSIDPALKPFYTPYPQGLPMDPDSGMVHEEVFVEPHLELLDQVSTLWRRRREEASGMAHVLRAADLPATTQYSGGIASGIVDRSWATFMIGPFRPPSARASSAALALRSISRPKAREPIILAATPLIPVPTRA